METEIIQGKVLSIVPGSAFFKNSWCFNVKWNGTRFRTKTGYGSAAAAKQAMREYVAQERKKHGLEEVRK